MLMRMQQSNEASKSHEEFVCTDQAHHQAEQLLLDFDLDSYHHLFSQDNNHPPTGSLQLDSPSSASPTGPPPNQPICLSSPPSWSSLDQLFLASLPQLPQSSPLFPLDLIPNPTDHQAQGHQQQPFNHHLSDFSFDAHLHDWNLPFDPHHSASSSSSEIPHDLYRPTCLQPSDFHADCCVELTENDCQHLLRPMFLQDQDRSPSEQYFHKELNRRSSEDDRDLLPTCIHPQPTTFSPSPPPRENTPCATMPVVPMKRPHSSHSQKEEHAPSVAPCNLSSLDHNPSGAVDQLSEKQDSIPLHIPQPSKPYKRTKPQATTHPSNSKPHICPECGKAFQRLTSLTQHKTTHNGERPFRCGFEGCNKSFTTSSNCKRHCKIHL